MVKPSFLIQVDFKRLESIEKRLKRLKIPYHLFVWTGAFPSKDAEYFVWYGQEIDEPSYFGTIDYLNKSEDGVFYQVDEDKKRERMRNVNEIFECITFGAGKSES